MGVNFEIFKVHTFLNLKTTSQAFFFFIPLKRAFYHNEWYQFHFSTMICVGITMSDAFFCPLLYIAHYCCFFPPFCMIVRPQLILHDITQRLIHKTLMLRNNIEFESQWLTRKHCYAVLFHNFLNAHISPSIVRITWNIYWLKVR